MEHSKLGRRNTREYSSVEEYYESPSVKNYYRKSLEDNSSYWPGSPGEIDFVIYFRILKWRFKIRGPLKMDDDLRSQCLAKLTEDK